jgi:hypothetical protein
LLSSSVFQWVEALWLAHASVVALASASACNLDQTLDHLWASALACSLDRTWDQVTGMGWGYNLDRTLDQEMGGESASTKDPELDPAMESALVPGKALPLAGWSAQASACPWAGQLGAVLVSSSVCA